MASRRDQIRMSDDEVRAFLAEQKVMTVGTIGPNGRPHLMPLWYVPDGLGMTGWTYAKSQKAKNLERDPRATIQVETGVAVPRAARRDDGVRRRARPRRASRTASRSSSAMPARSTTSVTAMVEQQAPKRVGLRFTPTRIVSWDHSKLGGTY